MKYYKVINGQLFVGIATTAELRKIQLKHNILIACTENEAQCIQVDENFYHAGWMKAIRDDIGAVVADVTEITKEEYDILYEMNERDEEIDPIPEPKPDTEPTPEPEDITVDYAKTLKIKEMNQTCQNTIFNGIDVVLSDGETHHFTLKEEDQINLFGKMKEIEMGATRVSYHANNSDNNDNRCAYYNAEDIQTIFSTGFFHKEFHSTYFESLKYYINSMESLEVISAVYYGMEIPEEYQSEPLKDKYKQLAQMTQVQGQSNENNEENNS